MKNISSGIKKLSEIKGQNETNILDVISYLDMININFLDYENYITNK